MQLYSTYTPSRHRVVEGTELGRGVDREFPSSQGEGLFVYFHTHTRKWVVAKWLNRKYGPFVDVMNLGYNLFTLGYDGRGKLDLRKKLYDRQLTEQMLRDFDTGEYRTLRKMTDDSFIRSEKSRPRKTQILLPS